MPFPAMIALLVANNSTFNIELDFWGKQFWFRSSGWEPLPSCTRLQELTIFKKTKYLNLSSRGSSLVNYRTGTTEVVGSNLVHATRLHES